MTYSQWIRLSQIKEYYLYYAGNTISFRKYIDKHCQMLANFDGSCSLVGKNNKIIKKYYKYEN